MNLLKQVRKTAKELIKANGSVTTLEIKTELRNKYPYERITQADVSDAMIEIYDNDYIKHLGFSDTGSYRIYTVVSQLKQAIGTIQTAVTGPAMAKITKTQMAELLYESDGDIVTVTYDKKEGDRRTMVGTINQSDYFNSLGYIKMLEFGQTFKLVDPRTLVAIHTNNVMYTLKD